MKSQLDIMQTIFVLIIAFIILTFSFIFIMGRVSSIEKKKIEQHIFLDQLKTYQLINYLPYLKCTSFSIKDVECYDKEKILLFKERIKEDELYFRGIFGKLKLAFLYGKDFEDKIVVYDSSGGNNKREVKQPILIYDPEQRNYVEGVMLIEIYN